MSELPIDQILCNDVVELAKEFPDSSIHAIVTDPPYGLEFMGEEWDTPRKFKRFGRSGEEGKQDLKVKKNFEILPRFFKDDLIVYQEWTTSWATEAFRVLKPGASMLVMGGTRTYHRMACGVEDAGFGIKDTVLWCYNSGFPKAQDLSKMIDKRLGKESERKVIGKERIDVGMQSGHMHAGRPSKTIQVDITAPATDLAKRWDGWKVGGLKPSYEPILWAVKPPEGTVIDNVLEHGVGAINVDGCRIGNEKVKRGRDGCQAPQFDGIYNQGKRYNGFNAEGGYYQGRYPANMIRTDRFYDGHDRFYFIPKTDRGERWFKCEVCGVCQEGTHLGNHDDHALHCYDCDVNFPKKEQDAHGNHKTKSNIIAHPTVKPVDLIEHLIKLVTRKGQIVADFFCGLGTTPVAARMLNRHYIGSDNNPDYIEIAKHRLAAIPKPLVVCDYED